MPHLRNNSGNIINNASIAAHIGQQGAVDYVSTKVSWGVKRKFITARQ